MITGHEPMLTTSENNYKRSIFSFQQSCINQTVTQSIGIHLKRRVRVIKKNNNNNKPKQSIYSAQVRKTALIVHSGFKTIKKPLTAGPSGTRVCVAVQCVQIILGRFPPCISLFFLFSVREMVQTEVVPLTQKGCGRCRRR